MYRKRYKGRQTAVVTFKKVSRWRVKVKRYFTFYLVCYNIVTILQLKMYLCTV